MKKIILLVSVFILFIAKVENTIATKPTLNFVERFTQVDIMKTPQEQARGLMLKKEYCQECMMVFVYNKPARRSFWMKNTYIPLDMIFVSPNGQVNKIFKNTKILRDNIIYTADNTQYVIEVNAGLTDKYKLKEGMFLSINWLLNYRVPELEAQKSN